VEPWLPLGERAGATVAEQRHDPGSPLALTRELVALRRRLADLRSGPYATLAAPPGAWAWRRGERTAVALNLSGEPCAVDGIAGEVALSTAQGRTGERLAGRIALAPWEGAVVTA
jgi:hypothetical protein